MKRKGMEVFFGLAFHCPYNNLQADCPLFVVDGLTFREKIEWINRAAPKLLESILIAHKNCCNK
jgi:hypothetical protein